MGSPHGSGGRTTASPPARPRPLGTELPPQPPPTPAAPRPAHLRADEARDAVDQPEVLAHLEPLVEGVDVPEVAARDDDPVGHLPVKLLQDLDRGGLLALQAKRVHAVCQVDRRLGGHLLDQLHAAVKVGVDGQHERAVGDRLHQLREGDLVGGEEHDGGDARGGAVRRQRRRGVAGRRAANGGDGAGAQLADAVYLGARGAGRVGGRVGAGSRWGQLGRVSCGCPRWCAWAPRGARPSGSCGRPLLACRAGCATGRPHCGHRPLHACNRLSPSSRPRLTPLLPRPQNPSLPPSLPTPPPCQAAPATRAPSCPGP